MSYDPYDEAQERYADEVDRRRDERKERAGASYSIKHRHPAQADHPPQPPSRPIKKAQ